MPSNSTRIAPRKLPAVFLLTLSAVLTVGCGAQAQLLAVGPLSSAVSAASTKLVEQILGALFPSTPPPQEFDITIREADPDPEP